MKKKDNLYVVEEWEKNGVSAVFTTKNGGVSKNDFSTFNMAYQVGDNFNDVFQNREILAKKLEQSLENFVYLEQMHTTNFIEVKQADCGKGLTDFNNGIKETDAAFTYENNIVLNAFFADCTPVFVNVPSKNLIGIIHAGWQGTVNGITDKFINFLVHNEKISPKDIHIVIGPSIDKANFEVEADVINMVKQFSNINLKDVYTKKNDDKYLLDVKLLNKLQALQNKVPIENIVVSDLDTYSADDFFSFRQKKSTGRMVGAIVQS